MKEHFLQKLLNDPKIVDDNIKDFLEKRLLSSQGVDWAEIEGHLLKAEHNLRFVSTAIKEKFFDWALTGCYYGCYHAALGLILSKGFTSKNHLATLCVMIKEFYEEEINKEDLEVFSNMLDYEDVLFYVETKHRREDASYSTKTLFDKKDVELVRLQTVMFVNKIKNILKDE